MASTRTVPMSIQEAAGTYNPAIQKYFLKIADTIPEFYKEFMNVETGVTDLVIKEQGMSGLYEADFDNGENATIAGDSPVETYLQTYTQERVSHMMGFTQKMWMFGIEKRKLQSVTQELRKAVVRKRDRLAIARVNNGFLSSYTDTGMNGSRTISTIGGDGQPLFSASHPREDGGPNMSNIITDESGVVNVPLDYAGLKALDRTAALITDARGNPMNIEPDTIIVAKGSSNAFKFKEIMKAIQKGEIPGSFNHDGAAVSTKKLIELPPQYLTNTGYWFAFDSKLVNQDHGLQYFEAAPITLDPPNVVLTASTLCA